MYIDGCNYEDNVPSLLPQWWLCSKSCTWTHDVPVATLFIMCLSASVATRLLQ